MKRARVRTHFGDLMSVSPCNSVPLCAAAIAFPSNTRDAPGNESDLGGKRSRGEREERREKEERGRRAGRMKLSRNGKRREEKKKKLRRRPIDELREFAGWSSPIGFGSLPSGRRVDSAAPDGLEDSRE